jgi:hypothetical protein
VVMFVIASAYHILILKHFHLTQSRKIAEDMQNTGTYFRVGPITWYKRNGFIRCVVLDTTERARGGSHMYSISACPYHSPDIFWKALMRDMRMFDPMCVVGCRDAVRTSVFLFPVWHSAIPGGLYNEHYPALLRYRFATNFPMSLSWEIL